MKGEISYFNKWEYYKHQSADKKKYFINEEKGLTIVRFRQVTDKLLRIFIKCVREIKRMDEKIDLKKSFHGERQCI